MQWNGRLLPAEEIFKEKKNQMNMKTNTYGLGTMKSVRILKVAVIQND